MNSRDIKNVRKKAERVLKTLETQTKKLTEAMKVAKEHLKGFDEIVGAAVKAPKAEKIAKPAKAAKAAPKAAKPVKAAPKAAKPVKAVKAAPKAAKPEKAAPKAAKPEKTAKGDKPPLRDAIYKVLGSKTMNAEGVLAALKEKGWEPNAQNQKGYVAYMLSSNKETFARSQDKGRGFYKRIEKLVEAKPEVEAPKAKPEAPKVEAKPKPAKNNKDEKILSELGVNPGAVAENPFRS
jgi:type I site-specific restriction-modification system R (restriction) subunit